MTSNSALENRDEIPIAITFLCMKRRQNAAHVLSQASRAMNLGRECGAWKKWMAPTPSTQRVTLVPWTYGENIRSHRRPTYMWLSLSRIRKMIRAPTRSCCDSGHNHLLFWAWAGMRKDTYKFRQQWQMAWIPEVDNATSYTSRPHSSERAILSADSSTSDLQNSDFNMFDPLKETKHTNRFSTEA